MKLNATVITGFNFSLRLKSMNLWCVINDFYDLSKYSFLKNSSDKVSVKLNQQLYDKLHKFVVYFIEKWKLLKIEDVEYRKQTTITNNKNSQPQINSLSSLLDGSVVRPSTFNSPVTCRSRVSRSVIKWSDADNSLVCKWMM